MPKEKEAPKIDGILIRALHQKGLTVKEIAEKTGATELNVWNFMKRARINGRKEREENSEKTEFATAQKIPEQYEIGKPISDDELAKIVEHRKAGHTYKQIMDDMGITFNRVNTLFKKARSLGMLDSKGNVKADYDSSSAQEPKIKEEAHANASEDKPQIEPLEETEPEYDFPVHIEDEEQSTMPVLTLCSKNTHSAPKKVIEFALKELDEVNNCIAELKQEVNHYENQKAELEQFINQFGA